MNTLVVAGILMTVMGKIVGIVYAIREENPTRLPFAVLVALGYAMLIGGGLAGGSFEI